MIRYYLLFILLWSSQIRAQSEIRAIVLDAETKKPLEFVDVYNDQNYTSTNSDGHFAFTTHRDMIKFNRLGYEPKSFSISALKNDTIYLKQSAENLDEVHLLDQDIYKKMIDHLGDNYSIRPYKERFFLRAMVAKDGNITKLVDVNGKLERQRLLGDLKNNARPKKNYTLEIENLRKAEIREDDIEFIFPSFETYFDLSTLVISLADSTKAELKNYGDGLVKLQVKSSKSDSEAYLIINTQTYAFEECYIKMDMSDAKFEPNHNTQSRTISNIIHSFYDRLPNGNYVLYKSTQQAVLECKYENKIYNYVQRIKYLSSDHFSDFGVKRNVRADKDIFKVKTRYEDEFWNDQNQLLLTDAMQAFIEKVKAGDSDFKIKSNF